MSVSRPVVFVPFQKALEFIIRVELEVVHEPVDLPVAVVGVAVFLPVSLVQSVPWQPVTIKGFCVTSIDCLINFCRTLLCYCRTSRKFLQPWLRRQCLPLPLLPLLRSFPRPNLGNMLLRLGCKFFLLHCQIYSAKTLDLYIYFTSWWEKK